MRLVDKSKEREKEDLQTRKLILGLYGRRFLKTRNYLNFQRTLHLRRSCHTMLVHLTFDFLKLFITEEFFQTMVKKTNGYVEKVIATSRPLRRRSILNLWVPVTVEEMKKFIGVIYHMGLDSMPSYSHYWQKTAQYGDKFVQKTMRRDLSLAIP